MKAIVRKNEFSKLDLSTLNTLPQVPNRGGALKKKLLAQNTSIGAKFRLLRAGT